jgi:hypothetical protein
MPQPIALIHLRWLTPREGGRQAPPSGPYFAATARFDMDSQDELFSIVLRLSCARLLDEGHNMEVELALLAPDRLPEIVARLAPGSQLLITEGARIVAEAQVLAVRQETVPPG